MDTSSIDFARLIFDAVVALAALGGLAISIFERRSRKKLEKRLFQIAVTVESRVSGSHFESTLVNQAGASARLLGFNYFVGNESIRPDDPNAWPKILTKVGLSSPAHLELDAHCFGLPQTILPQQHFYLVRGDFEQDALTILKALRDIKIKLTTQSPLGEEKTKVIGLVPE